MKEGLYVHVDDVTKIIENEVLVCLDGKKDLIESIVNEAEMYVTPDGNLIRRKR